ncbi:hypothetical protein [Streptomyces sp. NPDC056549]|uniref:hypothetical protein n=1 Tax=Streptomyces sp. NPDC056549 TaxID=3345864 RepID=UPI0036873104
MPLIRIACWNVQKGRNFSAAADHLNDWRPDIWLAQDILPAHQVLFEQATAMRCYPASTNLNTPNGNAVFVRAGGSFDVSATYPHPSAPWRPPANLSLAAMEADGQRGPSGLSMVSVHLCDFSAVTRNVEADWCTTLAVSGQLAVIGGSWNSFPTDEGPGSDLWRRLLSEENPARDPSLYTSRTYMENSLRHTDDRPDRIMTSAGFIDAARFAEKSLGRTSAVAPTVGHNDEARQGGQWRVDRVYLSERLAPAILDVEVGEAGSVGGISDCLPILVTLDGDRVATIMRGAPCSEPIERAEVL